MTNEERILVQESWQKVIPIAETAAELFYGRLFEMDPSVRPLFKGDMREQGAKLMKSLTLAVKSLERLDQLVPVIQDLGRRHVAYGVTPEHYSTVGGALLWTLQQGLGDAFTPEVEEAWRTTYQTLADVMIDAAKAA